MAMFDPNDAVDEELAAPRARWVNIIGVGLALALLVTLAITVVTRQHGKHPVAASTSPTPSPTASPAPNQAVPVPAPPTSALPTAPPTTAPPTYAPVGAAADQVLVSGHAFGESSVDGSADFLYFTDVQNLSRTPLAISYPIRLVGAHGTRLPLAFAGVYSKSAVEHHIGQPAKLTRLTSIGPLQTAEVLIRIQVDCAHPVAANAAQPDIVISLAGYDAAASIPLDTLVGDYGDLTAATCAAAAS